MRSDPGLRTIANGRTKTENFECREFWQREDGKRQPDFRQCGRPLRCTAFFFATHQLESTSKATSTNIEITKCKIHEEFRKHYNSMLLQEKHRVVVIWWNFFFVVVSKHRFHSGTAWVDRVYALTATPSVEMPVKRSDSAWNTSQRSRRSFAPFFFQGFLESGTCF